MTNTPPVVQPPDDFVLDAQPDPCPVTTYINGLDSEESRKTMRGCLNRVAELLIVPDADGARPPIEQLAWPLLRFEHTHALRTALRSRTTSAGEPWSPAYVNKHLVALRRLLKACRRHRLMTADDYESAADIDRVSGVREPVGRSVADDEIAKVLNTCLADDSPAGVRDAAVIALMHASGCRRSEVAGARRSNYDPAGRTLKIIGKGNKQRTVFLHARAGTWVNAWLAHVPPGPGALFRPIHWSGAIQNRHMQPPSIEYILTKRCKEAGVAIISPHDLRRTFISNFLRVRHDLSLAQRQAGHSSASTTALYDMRDDLELQEAVELLWLPTPDELRQNDAATSGDDEDVTV